MPSGLKKHVHDLKKYLTSLVARSRQDNSISLKITESSRVLSQPNSSAAKVQEIQILHGGGYNDAILFSQK